MPIRFNRTLPQPVSQARLGDVTRPAQFQQSLGVDRAAVNGTSDLAQLSAAILQEDQQRYIETRTRELDLQKRQRDNAVLNEYLASSGRNAVDARADALARIRANSADLGSDEKDPEVRRLWKLQDAAVSMASLNAIDRHYRSERMQWESDTHQARATVLQQDFSRAALGEGYDPQTGALPPEAQRLRSGYRDEIQQRGALLGAAKEAIDLELQKADAEAFGNVAASLIEQGRTSEAAGWIQAHGDKVDSGTAAKVRKIVQGAERDDRETRIAMVVEKRVIENWRRTHGVLSQDQPMDAEAIGRFMPEAVDLLDQAFERGEIDATTRDNVIGRIEKDFDRQRKADATVAQAMLDRAQSQLIQNPGTSWRDLSALDRYELDRRGQLATIVKFSDSGNRYDTEPAAFAEMLAMPAAKLKGMSAEEFYGRFRGRLNDADLKAGLEMLQKANAAPNTEPTTVLEPEARMREAAARIGMVGRVGAMTKDEAEVFYRFRDQVQQRLIALGHKASPDELQQTIDDVANDKVWRDLSWRFDQAVALAQVPPAELQDAYVMVSGEQIRLASIPAAERLKIIDSLRGQNQTVNEQAIAEMWVAGGKQGLASLGPPEQPAAPPAPPPPPGTDWLSDPARYPYRGPTAPWNR